MIVLGLALLATGGPLYARVGGWNVYDNRDRCAMARSYVRGAALWISHEHGPGRTTFVVTDPAFGSVKMNKRYRLNLRFVKGEKLNYDWGIVDATGLVTEREKGVRFVLDRREALDDLASARALGLLRDQVVVSALALDGSAAAVGKLRQCARAAHLRNPGDPLADAGKDDRAG